ncbi:AMIN domain-containing protein, partial [Pseudomonas yangonensis]|uniref:AMIN domain-containing protein n=1 Tax=Pseudomonas yangonensis TaxID=2579922 RepID=UPI0034D955F0
VLVGDNSAAASRSAVAPAVASSAPAKKTYGQQPKANRNIDFQRGAKGEGNVVLTLSDKSVATDIQEQSGKIRLDFAKTELPESLRVRSDVK